MTVTEQIFAYGTLRRPRPDTPVNDCRYYFKIKAQIKSIEPARLPEADLFDLGSYPAAVRGSGIIIGDLLTVSPEILSTIDHIEGHPTFFKRDLMTVLTDRGSIKAWVYWAPRRLVIGHRRIQAGDWLQRNDHERD